MDYKKMRELRDKMASAKNESTEIIALKDNLNLLSILKSSSNAEISDLRIKLNQQGDDLLEVQKTAEEAAELALKANSEVEKLKIAHNDVVTTLNTAEDSYYIKYSKEDLPKPTNDEVCNITGDDNYYQFAVENDNQDCICPTSYEMVYRATPDNKIEIDGCAKECDNIEDYNLHRSGEHCFLFQEEQ